MDKQTATVVIDFYSSYAEQQIGERDKERAAKLLANDPGILVTVKEEYCLGGVGTFHPGNVYRMPKSLFDRHVSQWRDEAKLVVVSEKQAQDVITKNIAAATRRAAEPKDRPSVYETGKRRLFAGSPENRMAEPGDTK